ncbi:MAG: LytTR family DNA-binding domain-containing protein [Clostridia bacterium]|nr:LytTR family DNA-binding domain-containing protein [Clostridia bacterium]
MRVAIIDDLAVCRQEIKEYLLRYIRENYEGEEPELDEFESGTSFLGAFCPQIYDVIFIDQYMEGMSGMDTAREIRKSDEEAALIFVTTSHDHAVDSYGVRACGYLIKPFTYEAFEDTMRLARVGKILNARFIALGDDRILLKGILWCDREGHYAQIHTDRQGVLRYRVSFSSLEAVLAAYPQFLPCYRGLIINMDRVRRMEELEFLMDTGEHVPFRKRDHKEIKSRFSQYMFRRAREEDLL